MTRQQQQQTQELETMTRGLKISTFAVSKVRFQSPKTLKVGLNQIVTKSHKHLQLRDRERHKFFRLCPRKLGI